jgi:hypothetical protein
LGSGAATLGATLFSALVPASGTGGFTSDAPTVASVAPEADGRAAGVAEARLAAAVAPAVVPDWLVWGARNVEEGVFTGRRAASGDEVCPEGALPACG